TLPDLINEGNLGLIKSAQRFDETKGFKFISYAVWWIRQSILQALAEQSRIVRLPLNKVGLTTRISKTFARLEQEFEREPTAQEVAEALDMDVSEVTDTMSVGAKHVSMDQPLGEGEDNTFGEMLSNPNDLGTDDELAVKASLKTEIERSLNTLTQRQREVIVSFFGIGIDHPMSLEDIGERYSLTRERVRQIKDAAINKLRSNSKCDLLRSFLGG
ncbi:MAG: sigma-70 family RNA polymerase sigma factor, partial [Bacteroidetes bacterium]|nr:sigma-70 family RNA polymerase sigma factor [Bacteroidota bacterium]